LASLTKLPWVVDFRDPMADTPASDWTRSARLVTKVLERRAMREAHAIIANTDSAAERLRRIYPVWGNKIHLIWNGFDPEARVRPGPLSTNSRKLISHVGELYQGRDVTPMLESIARLVDRARLSSDEFCVRLVGPMSAGSVPGPRFLEKAASLGWLELVPREVPKNEAQSISTSSGATLLIQPQSTLQVPGKLFEYIQIGRPILAYVPRNSPIERILQQSGIPYRCVYAESDPAAMDERIAEFFEMSWGDAVPSPWFEEQFNAERQTAALRKILELVAL
jgi:glycosyltransferase involved in cell wall biosynthesis